MPITETVRRTMHANAARKSRFTDPYYNSIDETQAAVWGILMNRSKNGALPFQTITLQPVILKAAEAFSKCRSLLKISANPCTDAQARCRASAARK
jgi:hypothetical protein